MKKMELEGFVIRYKSFTDLSEKVTNALAKVRISREKMEAALVTIKKKEKSLERFIGAEGGSKLTSAS